MRAQLRMSSSYASKASFAKVARWTLMVSPMTRMNWVVLSAFSFNVKLDFIMKKNFLKAGLMIIAALALTTNCAKVEVALEEVNQPEVKEAVPFELTVNSQETKTTTTDASTINWVADVDHINVFHAVHGGDPYTYSSNDDFSITSENLAAKKFTGSLQDGALDGAETYDWYVLYPYSSYVASPANTSTGYHFIGSSSKDTPQVQDGNDSKAHLAGQYFPLHGKVENVAANETPSITLNQALAVVKVHVTNSNTMALTVTDVSFTAPQPITGRFYIDFHDATASFTVAGAGYVSNTANLTVNSGSPIAASGSADFYIAIKPFTATSGQTLTVSVNGEPKTLILSSDVEFKAGKIKAVNYSFDADPVIYSTTFDYPVVKDGTNTYYNKGDEYEGVDEGGITSWYITYGNWANGNSAQLRVYNGTGGGFGEVAQKFDCSHVTYVTYDAVANNTSTTLTLTPYYSTDKGANWTAISADAKEITTTNTKYKFTVSSTGEHNRVRLKLVVSGARPSSGNTQITIDNLKIYGSGSIVADPSISASNVTDVPAIGGSGRTLSYTINNFSGADDIAATCDGTVVTAASKTSDGTVTYTVAPNYGTSARSTGTITLTSANEGINKVITVSQLGETFTVSTTTVTILKDASSATFTITTPTFGWATTVTPASEKNLTLSTPTSGSGSASAQTLTVNSSTAAAEEEQTLGTVVVYRNGNTEDPQAKTITIKKASTAVASTYSLVTSLTANTQYLLVNTDAEKVATGSVSSSTLQSSSVTITGGNSITGSGTIDEYAMTITALTGDDAGYYTLMFGTKYLKYTSSTSVALSNTATTDNEKWSISIDGETGLATILNKATNTRFIGWNGSSGWKAYSTSNYDSYPRPYLFKKD